MEIVDLLDQVNDRASLVVFIKALEADFTSDHDAWESWTVDKYIEAIGAWIADEGDIRVPMHFPDQAIRNQWHFLAACMYAGKIYE